MKKFSMIMMAVLLSTASVWAVPARKGTARVAQPDGTTLTIRLHGDEYLHFNTTDDGYTVLKDASGAYVYAQRQGDRLVPTTMIAHDVAHRTAAELDFLNTTPRRMVPKMMTAVANEQQQEKQRRAAARRAQYDYNHFKGLIILVEYNDCSFTRADYGDIMVDMVNKEGYTGYDDTRYGRFTGSVRDYFYDNSNGVFTPQFDIVGPVTVDRSKYYVEAFTNAGQLMYDVIQATDSLVNFRDYDGDGDGTVDMVFFLFAGAGANVSGNDPRLLWPHAGMLYNPVNYRYIRKDNVNLGRYACSTELFGLENSSIIDGIGTICHEFSHVLGLPDFYDTDYEESGGESNHPSEWSVMAGGSYQNNSRTPVGYTLFERYAIGFASPQLLSEEGSYELQPLGDSNQGFRMNTRVKKEYFLFENRQKSSKWDAYLPGHGLLVFRVDSTNASVWQQNQVNVNPNHNYFELVRANGGQGSASTDPYPGTKKVHTLNNVTSPGNLLTWSGKESPFGLENIQEQNGKISFNLVDVNILRAISLPENVTVAKGFTYQLVETREPDYAPYTLTWESSDPAVVTVSSTGLLTGMSVGEATITVTANGDANLSATCKVIVNEVTISDHIAAFKTLDQDAEGALTLTDAQVIYAYDDDIFVRDASGAIDFYLTGFTFEEGDVLNGVIYGRFCVEDRMPLFLPVEGQTKLDGITITKGDQVQPREVELADLNESCYADLITLKAVTLERSSGVWIAGNHEVRLFNPFRINGISVPKDIDDKYFDVVGIYHTNTLSNKVIDEIALFTSPVEVEGPSAIRQVTLSSLEAKTPVVVYTADGRLVTTTTLGQFAQLPLSRGIYVLKTNGQQVMKVVK